MGSDSKRTLENVIPNTPTSIMADKENINQQQAKRIKGDSSLMGSAVKSNIPIPTRTLPSKKPLWKAPTTPTTVGNNFLSCIGVSEVLLSYGKNLQEYNKEIDDIFANHQDRIKKTSTLRKDIVNIKSHLSIFRENIGKCLESKDRFLKQCRNLLATIEKKEQENVEGINTIQAKYEKIKSQLLSSCTELEKTRTKVMKLEKQLSNVKDIEEKWALNMADKEKEWTEKQSKLKESFKEEKIVLQKQFDDEVSKGHAILIENLESEKIQLSKEFEEQKKWVENELESKSKDYDLICDEKQKLVEEKNQFQMDMKALQESNATTKQELNLLEETKNELDNSLKEAMLELQGKENMLIESKEKNDENQMIIQQLKDGMDTLNGQMNDEKMHTQHLKETNNTRFGTLEKQLEEYKVNKETLAKEIDGLKLECKTISQDLQEKNSQYSLLQDEIRSKTNQYEMLEMKMESRIQNFKLKEESLNNQVNTLQTSNEQLMSMCNNTNSQFQDLNKKLDTMKENTGTSDVAQLEKICNLQVENDNLKGVINTHLDEIKKLKNVVKESKQLKEKLFQAEMQRRKLHNTIQDLKGQIRVCIRVRGGPKKDIDESAMDEDDDFDVVDVKEDQSSIELRSVPDNSSNGNTGPGSSKGNKEHLFKFDRVFSNMDTQKDVFNEVQDFVTSALDGYNVSILAYGQTGAGKTYTMQGGKGEDDMGLIPRTAHQLFGTSSKLKEQGWEYKLTCSYLEIYNETIRDLLYQPNKNNKSSLSDKDKGGICTVHNIKGGVSIDGLSDMDIESPKDVQNIVNMAEKRRSVAATSMNAVSSRSHSVFIIKIKGENAKRNMSIDGSLYLCDLAGSERLKKSGATGDRLKETQAINKSLSALGDVFTQLSQKEKFIRYRDSKLTNILQPCLEGSGKAMMVIAVAPETSSSHESLCSLRFAQKVSQVELGKVKKNVNRLKNSMR